MFYLQQTNLTDYCIWHLVCSVNWCIFRLPDLGNPGLSAGPLASINGCHQSLDATLQHYSPNLGQEPGPRLVWLHSGLHPRKFHYHNINTSRCQDLAGFLFTLLLRSLFPSLIFSKSPRPSRARGCLARSERWILHETSLDFGVEQWAGVQGS